MQPLKGVSWEVAIAKGCEHSVDKPGQSVVKLVRRVGGWVEQVLKGGAAVCVELDQQVAQVKGVTLIGAGVVGSRRLAVF